MIVLLSQSSSQRKGYTDAVDWWSLGVTLYKLFTGSKPFEKQVPAPVDPDDDSLFPPPKKESEEYKILFQEVKYPSYMSDDAKDVLNAFLNTKEEERLGYGHDGIDDIKNHKFFDGINWDKLLMKHQIPPFLPDHTEMDDSQRHDSFKDMLVSIGKEHWLEKHVNSKFQHFFDTWDYVSPDTLRIEFGIANEMDRLDKKFKVHQDKQEDNFHEGLSSYNTSLHFFNSVAPMEDKYEQKLFFDPKDNVDGDENEGDGEASVSYKML
jgi:serine/threonine protein kinase